MKIKDEIIDRLDKYAKKCAHDKKTYSSILRIPRLCDKYHNLIRNRYSEQQKRIIEEESRLVLEDALADNGQSEEQFMRNLIEKQGRQGGPHEDNLMKSNVVSSQDEL